MNVNITIDEIGTKHLRASHPRATALEEEPIRVSDTIWTRNSLPYSTKFLQSLNRKVGTGIPRNSLTTSNL